MSVSIRDVAKAAGVTVGTVSRAFNGYSDIREETKQTILTVAKELGYVPNLNARRLSGKNCQTLAIILAGFLSDRGLSNDLVITMLRGASRYASANAMEFAVYVLSSEQQKEKSFEQFCWEHSLTGAMCFGLKTTDVYYESLKYSTVPCVTVDVLVEGENVGYVGTDEIRAMEDITELVLQNNHKRVVFLNGREQATVCALRREGIENVLTRNGLKLEAMYYTDFNIDQARSIVMSYIAEHGTSGATAFICANDMIAMGACHAIQKSGYRVGEDFSVTGFDGTVITALAEPEITTVNQNMEQKGYAAAEMLRALTEGKSVLRKRNIPYTLTRTRSLGYAIK